MRKIIQIEFTHLNYNIHVSVQGWDLLKLKKKKLVKSKFI